MKQLINIHASNRILTVLSLPSVRIGMARPPKSESLQMSRPKNTYGGGDKSFLEGGPDSALYHPNLPASRSCLLPGLPPRVR